MKKTLFFLGLLCWTGFAGLLPGTFDPGPSTAPCQSIMDMKFLHSGTYANYWEALRMRAEFLAPSGDTQRINGFCRDTGEWRFRFSPTQVGAWSFSATITNGADTFSTSGVFTCTPGTRKPQLIISPDNPRRFAYGDSTPFNATGIQSCWGLPFTQIYDIATWEVRPFKEWIDTFAWGGYNLYRVGMGNCAPKIEDTVSVDGIFFKAAEADGYDSILSMARSAGYRVILNPCFDCKIYSDMWSDSASRATVLRYLDYLQARYMVYADIIELNNEPYDYNSMPWAWYSDIINRIRQNDIYHKLIGQELPPQYIRDSNYVRLLDVAMPHYYYDGTAIDQDKQTLSNIRSKQLLMDKFKPMPVIMGEQGYNTLPTFFADSPKYQRIRYWTAFFNQGSLVSWEMTPWGLRP